MRDSQIATELGPVLAPFGLELETVEIIPAGKRRLMRVVVDGDGPDGRGPSLDDIAEATKALSIALDTSPTVGSAPYTLEVSSRGVGRPLEQPRHWRRNHGRLVQVDLTDGEQLTGRVTGSDDVAAVLDAAGKSRTITYAEVAKALVQVEFNRPRPADGAAESESED